MSFLARIREINQHDRRDFADLIVDDRPIGAIRHDRTAILLAHGKTFIDTADGALTFASALESPEARTAAVAAVAEDLADAGAIPPLRREIYPAKRRFGDDPLFHIDRAAVPFFGLRAWGVHLNGYTYRRGALHLWIGERAMDRPTFPGMLDNMVAGGQPAGLGLLDNLIKECAEEADVPADLARQARPVGAITYTSQAPEGLKPDVLFCYDLELPEAFVPRNTDGEIAAFHLWPVEQVAETVATTRRFKYNCNLVIIDFLIRHGMIPPDHPDYVDLLQGMHP